MKKLIIILVLSFIGLVINYSCHKENIVLPNDSTSIDSTWYKPLLSTTNSFGITNLIGRNGSINTSGIVSWNSGVPTYSYVNYGLTSVYGNSTEPQGPFSTQSILILHLLCNSTYHYQAVSIDLNNDTIKSLDGTFSTKACKGDTIPPVITDLSFPNTIQNFYPSTSSTLSTKFSITASDNIGISKYYFSESSTTPTINDPNWVSVVPSTFKFSRERNYNTEGFNVLYAWVKDQANNISKPKYSYVWIDTSCTSNPISISTPITLVPRSSSEIFKWSTNITGINHVDYGLSTNYTMSTSPTDPYGTSVNILCTGLVHGNTYYYHVVSQDPCGNNAIIKGSFNF